MTDVHVHRGLVGVVVGTTAISAISHSSNSLLYRGLPAHQLAKNFSFTAIVYLLWYGTLPSAGQLEEFEEREREQRHPGAPILRVLEHIPDAAHPMDVCRTVASFVGATESTFDRSPEAMRAQALKLFALMPTIVAAQQRRLRGHKPIPPRADLDYVDNFFAMCFDREPSPAQRRAFHTALVLYAEHSLNASTFAARVIASTESDYHSAITGALGALKGPLHGGANEAVIELLLAIHADRRDTRQWACQALADGTKIPGFGHRIYKEGDTRVPPMFAALRELVTETGREDLLSPYSDVENVMREVKNLRPNLDYPTALAYHLIGFDAPLFTPLFAASRLSGWSAHILEQVNNNVLIRPQAQYTGPPETPVPEQGAVPR